MEFGSFLKLTRQVHAVMQIRLDFIKRCCNKDLLSGHVKQTFNCYIKFGQVPVTLITTLVTRLAHVDGDTNVQPV